MLKKSCADFDGGDEDEAVRIAIIIRILAYDRGQSRSLLGQLGMKGISFEAYGYSVSGANLLGDTPLVMGHVTTVGDSRCLPLLDKGPLPPRKISFDKWWDETVIRLPDDLRLSRGEVILLMTNQDGGAHVDAEIDELYHRIAKNNELGWTWISGSRSGKMAGVEKATVRQIAFEIMNSVQPELDRKAGNNECSCGSGRKYRYCHGKTRSAELENPST
ncbi:MAG: hypothetical protein KGH70_02120 [Rhodospirillales bacterium]|nr:hypothetical protein [Rhodospirillales bacterium]